MAEKERQSAKKHYFCRRFLLKQQNDVNQANKTARI
jgi:hypothetical protein